MSREPPPPLSDRVTQTLRLYRVPAETRIQQGSDVNGPETKPRWWQRLLQGIAVTRVGAWIFSQSAHHIDRILLAFSGGRVSMAQVLAGLPTVRLTTTGAKSGRKRTVPVMGMRDGERWVVVASSWGGDSHPAWYHNLRANPEVELTYRAETNRYIAHVAAGETRERYWERATELYRGFEAYNRRAEGREFPIVVLTPIDEDDPA